MTLPTRREARDDSRRSAEPTDAARRRRRIALFVGIPVVVLLLLAGWLAFKALTVKSALEAAQTSLQHAQDGGDLTTAIGVVSREAAVAAGAAGDPVWRAAEILPVAGDNLRGVRLASEALDVVANDIGKPVLDMQGDGQGGILARALPVLQSGSARLEPLTADLAQLSTSDALIGPVKSGVVQVSDLLMGMQPVLAILPDLLGAGEAKNYLLVFQNNAEALALGGSAASETMIRADAGDLKITGQASSAIFDRDKRDIGVDISDELTELYGVTYGTRVNMSTTRPDWPSSAQMVSAFWNRTIDDTQIDGAISIDPLALSRILVATGPITVPGPDGDFELTSENAVETLLSDSYTWWDAYTEAGALASDAFFAGVAGKVFEAIAAGDFDMKDLAWAVNESGSQGSILVWMRDPGQQAYVEGFGRLAGTLPTDNAAETVLGVYFRDVSASKIDYYLDTAVDTTMSCVDGTTTLTSTATLTLDISQAEADALPAYVKSYGADGAFYSKQVFMYAPPGMSVTRTDVKPLVEGAWGASFREGNTDLERVVAPFQMRLRPGDSVEVTATFEGADEFAPLDVRTTPMIRATELSVTDECR